MSKKNCRQWTIILSVKYVTALTSRTANWTSSDKYITVSACLTTRSTTCVTDRHILPAIGEHLPARRSLYLGLGASLIGNKTMCQPSHHRGQQGRPEAHPAWAPPYQGLCGGHSVTTTTQNPAYLEVRKIFLIEIASNLHNIKKKDGCYPVIEKKV